MSSYSRLNQEDITVSTDKIVTNAWSDDTNELTTFFTSSTQVTTATSTAQGNFFLCSIKKTIMFF